MNTQRMLTSLLLFAALLASGARAQTVLVQPGLSPLSFSDNNLFKVHLVPSGSASEPLKMEASLFLDGKRIATQTGISDPATNTVRVLSGALPEPFASLSKMAVLPAGTYTLCITVRGSAQQCQTFTVTPRSNAAHLRLTAPVDGAVLEERYPLLAWSSSFQGIPSGVTFRLVVATKEQAQRRNFFLHKAAAARLDASRLTAPHLTYPVDAPPLEVGKEYVWGVEAYAGEHLLAQSDVWSFTLKDPVELNELPIALSYIDIGKINDLPSYYILGALKLRYVPSLSTETGTIRILDGKNKEVKLKSNTLRFDSDRPYEVYNLEEKASLKHLEKYVVELSMASGLKKRFVVTYVHPPFYQP